MSGVLPPEPPQTGGGGTGGTGTAGASNYALLASEQTVQVLTPNLVNDIQYCTIVTIPSGAIVSWPLTLDQFSNDQGAPDLAQFAGWIERLLSQSEVAAAVGGQTIDASGLIQDNVVFTVQYEPPGTSGTSVTAEAVVPVMAGSVVGLTEQRSFYQRAQSAIADVYSTLQSTAGG